MTLSQLKAVELSEPVRYGNDTKGVRVILDMELPRLLPAQQQQVEALLMSVPVPWLPAGKSWKQRVDDCHKEMLGNILALRAEFPNNAISIHWFSDSSIETTWSSPTLLSFHATNLSYLGGAHENRSSLAIIIDVSKNRVLTLDDLIKPADQPAFSELLTELFKIKKRLPATANLREAGLLVEQLPAKLPLITAAGISVRYDPYEIAPYAFGSTTIDIPRLQISPFLSSDPWAEVKP
jgi:hypothetical protein